MDNVVNDTFPLSVIFATLYCGTCIREGLLVVVGGAGGAGGVEDAEKYR